MSQQKVDICERTFQFSLRIISLCSFLNQTPGVGRELSRQLVRSGTSIGANVEESRRCAPNSKYPIQNSKLGSYSF